MPSSYSDHVIVPCLFAGMTSRAERRRDGLMKNATSTKGVLCRYSGCRRPLDEKEKVLKYENS
jgi:hypothetical protein